MADIREALVAHLERVGVGYGLHDGLKREVLGAWADAILAEFDVTPRGERVKPSVEDVARVLAARWWTTQTGETEPWESLTSEEQTAVIENNAFDHIAPAVLALISGRAESEVKAEALREVAPACNCEDDYARLNDRADRIEKEADRDR